jgi:aminoglycoside phosphotransferase (APT) family kinase protein
VSLVYLDPKDFTEPGVLSALALEFPGSGFRRARLIDTGWNNYGAVVDETWMFRFPRDAKFPRDREKAVLDALKGKVLTPIPVVEFWGQRLACMGYRYLPGKQLTRAELEALPIGRIEALAQDLAYFLAQCHLALSVSAAEGLGIQRKEFSAGLAQAKQALAGNLEPHETALFERTLKDAEGLKEGPDFSFLYNDLHHGNFVVDETYRLAGVFDFGDVAWGDRAAEFRLPKEGEARLFDNICGAYEAFTKRAVDREKARLFAWIGAFHLRAESLGKPESFEYRHAKWCLRRYAEEMEML